MGEQHESWRSWVPRFDAWAPTYDADTRDPWLSYEAAWAFVERSLRSGMETLDGRRIADVGCGTGEFLHRIAAAGGSGIGIDPSAGMRDVAARKVPEARILDGHLTAIPLADGSVDAVVATYVVSHLEPREQPAALAEILRVVADAGPASTTATMTSSHDATARQEHAHLQVPPPRRLACWQEQLSGCGGSSVPFLFPENLLATLG